MKCEFGSDRLYNEELYAGKRSLEDQNKSMADRWWIKDKEDWLPGWV